ncbi:MAG: universal stress protein [Acidobacteriia bacterium]|nr:universal stress protein [Terriglobia bacterium]
MKLMEPALSLSLKNILLATDFSSCSEIAVKYALALARRHSSQVHTIHVEGPDSYQLLQPEAFAIAFRGLNAGTTDVAGLLNGLLAGLPHQAPLEPGAIWKVINDVIVRNEIDLLVLATHGRTGLSRIFGGSVAEDIFRNVPCPVLTLGPGVKDFNAENFNIQKILMATDFDSHSAAPTYAVWLANDFKAALTVVNVLHGRTEEPNVDDLARKFKAQLPEDLELWSKPGFATEYGNPADGILAIADDLKPDLMVLGARHPEPAQLNSHILWATAGRLVSEAKCPVLTVRERDLSMRL